LSGKPMLAAATPHRAAARRGRIALFCRRAG
jgi:hypothetical protein